MKKRVSLHNGKKSQKTGKVIKPPHNDTDREKNENVKADLVKNNIYYNCYDGEYNLDSQDDKMSFQDVELLYYTENYQAALDSQNERHIKARQKNRVKSMSDWLNSPMYAPTETILRVGNVDDGFANINDLKKMTDDYIEYLNDWSAENDDCMHILNYALHADEVYTDDDTREVKLSSPHVHIRCVWEYIDDNENLAIGIEKALEQAGYDLPDPNSKSSRYNNRMMIFTAECREKWQEIVISYGYDIETEPKPTKRKAKDKQTYVAEKRANKEIVKALTMQEKVKLQQLENDRIARENEIIKQNLNIQMAELEKKQAKLNEHEETLKSRDETLDECFAEIRMTKKELLESIKLNEQLAEKIKDEQKREALLAENKRISNRFNNVDDKLGLIQQDTNDNDNEINYK